MPSAVAPSHAISAASAAPCGNILVDTIRGEQERGKIGPGDPIELAEITWSLSHGIATLGMARHLARTPTSIEDLAVLGCRFLEDGMRRS
jgi:Tetracyclin repressor-like, C-terminal domain